MYFSRQQKLNVPNVASAHSPMVEFSRCISVLRGRPLMKKAGRFPLLPLLSNNLRKRKAIFNIVDAGQREIQEFHFPAGLL
jgi:hypothetical protein